MAFTKRHYEEVARIIRTRREGVARIKAVPVQLFRAAVDDYAAGAKSEIQAMQSELRRMFAADNPRFDGTRFDMACEPRSGK
jgi:hypothetical protein